MEKYFSSDHVAIIKYSLRSSRLHLSPREVYYIKFVRYYDTMGSGG